MSCPPHECAGSVVGSGSSCDGIRFGSELFAPQVCSVSFLRVKRLPCKSANHMKEQNHWHLGLLVVLARARVGDSALSFLGLASTAAAGTAACSSSTSSCEARCGRKKFQAPGPSAAVARQVGLNLAGSGELCWQRCPDRPQLLWRIAACTSFMSKAKANQCFSASPKLDERPNMPINGFDLKLGLYLLVQDMLAPGTMTKAPFKL